MTREEALNQYRYYNSEWYKFTFEDLLNDIYDDFEQQLKEAKDLRNNSVLVSQDDVDFLQLQNQQYADIVAELEQRIEELEAPKSCEDCKHYDGSHKCNNENSIAWETSNRVYHDDYCKDYEPKDKQ